MGNLAHSGEKFHFRPPTELPASPHANSPGWYTNTVGLSVPSLQSQSSYVLIYAIYAISPREMGLAFTVFPPTLLSSPHCYAIAHRLCLCLLHGVKNFSRFAAWWCINPATCARLRIFLVSAIRPPNPFPLLQWPAIHANELHSRRKVPRCAPLNRHYRPVLVYAVVVILSSAPSAMGNPRSIRLETAIPLLHVFN